MKPFVAGLVLVVMTGCCPSEQPLWSKWGEPKITSTQWEGTTIWQMRTNFVTGEVQLRAYTASAKGNYYK